MAKIRKRQGALIDTSSDYSSQPNAREWSEHGGVDEDASS